MSYYNATCRLISEITTRDERGISIKSEVSRPVYCNAYTMGAQAYYAAETAGVHPVATLQIRKADYNGETLIEYEGRRLAVDRVSVTPDFVTLTLTERVGDRG